MRLNSKRGEISTAVMVAVAVVVLLSAPSGGAGKNHWWEFWRKNPVAEAQKSQAELDAIKAREDEKIAAAKGAVNAENKKQLETAHEGSVATVAAIRAAQNAVADGNVPTKQLDTAMKTATVTKDALDAATGTVVAPQRVRELEQMVSDLNAGIQSGTKALEAVRGALDASISREKELSAKLTAVEESAKIAIAEAEKNTKTANEKAQGWALERDAIAKQFEKWKFWGSVAVLGALAAWLASIILPIAARFSPALAPLSKAFGAVWAPGMQVAQSSAQQLNRDFVAMTEMLKGQLRDRITPEEMTALKAKISKEWMTVEDGSAAEVERIKRELRL